MLMLGFLNVCVLESYGSAGFVELVHMCCRPPGYKCWGKTISTLSACLSRINGTDVFLLVSPPFHFFTCHRSTLTVLCERVAELLLSRFSAHCQDKQRWIIWNDER